METKREELRLKFYDHLKSRYPNEKIDLTDVAWAFDWFWKEIEAREAEINALNDDVRGYRNGHEVNSKRYAEALSEISRLEATLEAADEVMKSLHQVHRPNWVKNTEETYELIEKYNQLKKQSAIP